MKGSVISTFGRSLSKFIKPMSSTLVIAGRCLNKGHLPLIAAAMVVATAGLSLRLKQDNRDAFDGDLDSHSAQVEVLEGGQLVSTERILRPGPRYGAAAQPRLTDRAELEPPVSPTQVPSTLDPGSYAPDEMGLRAVATTRPPPTSQVREKVEPVYGILDDRVQVQLPSPRRGGARRGKSSS